MRLENKTAMIVGAGQSPGETVGNGRAVCLLFAREGAEIACVDRTLEAAEETAEIVRAEGGKASAFAADITKEAEIESAVRAAEAKMGRIDILHNNVGYLPIYQNELPNQN